MKQTKIGTIISLDLPEVACQLSGFGFDFIFIDLEHGNVSDRTIASVILSKKEDCRVFIRIAEISEAAVKHALDIGCDGIIAPRVESMDEIKILIDYSFYPPVGKRSMGIGLANRYGLKMKDYTDNFQPIILPQVESVKGLEIAGEIASNEKIAGIFIGPYDLSMSLGIPGQYESELFKKSCESVRDLCTAHNKYFCTYTANLEAAKHEINKRTDMIAIGVDANLYLNTYVQMLHVLKDE